MKPVWIFYYYYHLKFVKFVFILIFKSYNWNHKSWLYIYYSLLYIHRREILCINHRSHENMVRPWPNLIPVPRCFTNSNIFMSIETEKSHTVFHLRLKLSSAEHQDLMINSQSSSGLKEKKNILNGLEIILIFNKIIYFRYYKKNC